MESIIKYKVVTVWRRGLNDQPRYASAFAEGEFTLSYSTNKFTKAKVGGLLVFNTFEEAQVYEGRSHKEIWKVEVKDKVELPMNGSNAFYNTKFIKNLWKGNNWPYGFTWPKGTEAYKQVKLLEKVSRNIW